VFGAGGAVGLGEDVGDAGQLDAGADALAGGDARARAGRDQDHRAGAAGAFHLMRDRRPLEVQLDHVLARVLARLLDGHRDFVGLAITNANVSATIAGDDEGAEGERSPALDDFVAAIDSHDGGFHAGFIAFTVASAAAPAALSAAATATAVSAAAADATATLLLLLIGRRLGLRFEGGDGRGLRGRRLG